MIAKMQGFTGESEVAKMQGFTVESEGFSSWTGVFTEKNRVISYGGGLGKKMKIEFN